MPAGVKSQLPQALTFLLLALGLAAYFTSQDILLAGTWMFGLGLGYVLQRSRFCFVACFRDPWITGNTSLSRALVLSLIIATLAFTLASLYLDRPGEVYPVGWHMLLGGFIFGTGMVLAGGCATGTLTRAGEGHVLQWLVLIAFIGGSLWGAHDFGWWHEVLIKKAPLIFFPERVGWFGALLLQIVFLASIYLALLFIERRVFPGYPDSSCAGVNGLKEMGKQPFWTRAWPYWVGGVLIALLDAGLLAFRGSPWGITTAFTYWGAKIYRLLGGSPESWYYFTLPENALALGKPFFLETRTVLDLGIIGGSLLSALLASEFRIRFPRSLRGTIWSLAGGLLMGYGARLGMGCNIGSFFNGIASLSLHGFIFGLGLILGSYLGVHLLLRFLVGDLSKA
ncbi:MAG: YeeE/YedE family protein [Thermanaeromonas sp.]|uniref:YeeE/YedE family protein n=1 Tax=Thermanaeromonas sp. TaxID=2003697 RepID=UPI00243D0DD3|nr:YeeE/YedE family protein [Thermanaeromonas sp.]MCG0278708.1 YeeE/YedE family protein [Thermanaeromonas sp.]